MKAIICILALAVVTLAFAPINPAIYRTTYGTPPVTGALSFYYPDADGDGAWRWVKADGTTFNGRYVSDGPGRFICWANETPSKKWLLLYPAGHMWPAPPATMTTPQDPDTPWGGSAASHSWIN